MKGKSFALLWLVVGCDRATPRANEQGAVSKAKPAVQAELVANKKNSSKEAEFIPLRVQLANHEIVKLNYAQAERLLQDQVGAYAAIARARLALYRANCEEARAHLSSSLVQNEKGAQELIHLAESCFGATAGASIVEDQAAGIWLRLQDSSDKVFAPLIFDVAQRARASLERDLGEELPRPLRIDLVRDLFSLAAVSGLPVDAAETTGTVAVARWGRVTMVSPRAIASGFPWADTLAHEITHLLISRATLERAPLWLQEGIAKRQERRWREAQLFDETLDHGKRSYEAQISGRSIGVDKIGPSIAMLPSAVDAATAFSEVTSFMEFWILRNGPRALNMLLRDMEVAPDADAAIKSVSGFNVADWQALWRSDLVSRFSNEEPEDELNDTLPPRTLARALRLVELLTVDGQPDVAEFHGAVELDRAPHVAALRFLTARAALLQKDQDESLYLGDVFDVREAHAGWLAFYAAQQSQLASDRAARPIMDQARSLDPLLPEVVCGGQPWVGLPATLDGASALPFDPDEHLCVMARKLPVRGSR